MAWADSKDSGAYGIASVPLDEKKKIDLLKFGMHR